MVLETFPRESNVQLLEHGITPLNRKLRDFLIERVDKSLKLPLRPRKPLPPKRPKNPLISTVPDPKCEKCRYEVSKFNPSFWNAASVQPYNNCYNYARNWRTNTFAQPGRAHGAQTGTMACNSVTTAAMADGLVKRCICLPDSEYPRRLMALVIDLAMDSGARRRSAIVTHLMHQATKVSTRYTLSRPMLQRDTIHTANKRRTLFSATPREPPLID
jgi:hypothetical protein